MADYQQLVDEIRYVLLAGDHAVGERLERIASSYAEACDDVNRQLRRCELFLQKGLRSEALQFADVEPPLRQIVAILNFSERAQWDQFTVACGLPSAPRLLLATATALKDAYSNVQPLEPLLRKHRELALSHASLRERLAVLRELKQGDGNPSSWDEEIAGLERARIDELEAEVRQALHEDEAEDLNRLREEIRATPWIVPAPLRLLQTVEWATRQRESERLRQSLETLAGDIHDAVAAYDVERVKDLRRQWNEAVKSDNLASTDPLWSRVSGSFDWLAEQEQRQAEEREQKGALHELESALGRRSTLAEIERLYRTVVMLDGRGVPEEVEQRYRVKVQSLQAASRRRNRILGVVLLMGTGVAGVLIWLGIERMVAANQLTGILRDVKSMRDAGDLLEAEHYLQELATTNPRVAGTPEVRESMHRIAAEADQERQRQESFHSTIKEAEAAPSHEARLAALAHADALARRPEEKAEVLRLRAKRSDETWRGQRQREEDFRTRTGSLRNRLQDLEQAAALSPEAVETADLYRELQSELTALQQHDDVAEELRRTLQSIALKLQAVDRVLASAKEATQLAEQMTRLLQTTGREGRYTALMQQFAAKFPDTPRGKAFGQALLEKDSWEAAIAWANLIRPWRGDLLDIRAGEAKDRAESAQVFITSHPGFVDVEIAQEYLRSLRALAERDEANAKSAAAQLRAAFRHFLIRDLWVLVDDEDNVYYLPQDPAPKIDKARGDRDRPLVNFRYLVGLDGTERSRNAHVTKIKRFGRAPQSLIADKVALMPTNFGASSWEQSTIQIAQQIWADSEMDPILQLTLLRKVLELAARGSYPLAIALGTHQRVFVAAKGDLPKVAWPTPGSPEAAAKRPDARKLLERLPALEPVLTVAATQKEHLVAKIAATDREIAGWLAWMGQKGWQCQGAPSLPDGAQLVVIVKGEEQQLSWKPVGKVLHGKPVIEAAQAPNLLEGRVVFTTDKRH
jgi:hypothetical protein